MKELEGRVATVLRWRDDMVERGAPDGAVRREVVERLSDEAAYFER